VSGVTGTVTAATIHVYATKIYAAHTLSTFRVHAPLPWDVTGTVETGLRAEMADNSIEALRAHPDVLKAKDWPADWREPYNIAKIKEHDHSNVSVTTPDGFHHLRVRMPVDVIRDDASRGEGTGISIGFSIDTIPPHVNTPPTELLGPEEAWMQYEIQVDEGWTSLDDEQLTGGKWPGLAGRFGKVRKYDGKLYWEPEMEGGRPGLGIYHPGGTFTYGGYSPTRPDPCILGWSACAGWHAQAQGQHSNPMRMCTALHFYAYHPDQPRQGTGDVLNWPNAFMEAGRKHVIEEHVRMNSVVGPFDQYGNGVGVYDGILEAWLDGIKVYSNHAFRFRQHPCIGIEEAWVRIKNGGTLSPFLQRYVTMGPVIVAKRYIGPPKAITP
jgi:hypothetical protein